MKRQPVQLNGGINQLKTRKKEKVPEASLHSIRIVSKVAKMGLVDVLLLIADQISDWSKIMNTAQ